VSPTRPVAPAVAPSAKTRGEPRLQGLGAGGLSPRPRGTRRAGEDGQHGPDNRGCRATAVRLRKAIETGQACERSAPVRNHGQLARLMAASVPVPVPHPVGSVAARWCCAW